MKLFDFIQKLSSYTSTEILVLDAIEENELARGEAWKTPRELCEREVIRWDWEIKDGKEAVIIVWI